jgi:hypothetical protein
MLHQFDASNQDSAFSDDDERVVSLPKYAGPSLNEIGQIQWMYVDAN